MRNTSLWTGILVVLATMSLSVAALADERDRSPRCHPDPEERLKPFLSEFGLTELPEPFVPPNITFAPAVQTGKLLYISGGGPALPQGQGFITGRVPSELSIEQANRAALLTGINQLAVMKKVLGGLDRVKRIVKVFGMVNSDPGFTAHPAVINGASDLFVAVFGECGLHARSAVGMASLPFHIPVEIDMIVEVRGRGDD